MCPCPPTTCRPWPALSAGVGACCLPCQLRIEAPTVAGGIAMCVLTGGAPPYDEQRGVLLAHHAATSDFVSLVRRAAFLLSSRCRGCCPLAHVPLPCLHRYATARRCARGNSRRGGGSTGGGGEHPNFLDLQATRG